MLGSDLSKFVPRKDVHPESVYFPKLLRREVETF